MSRIGTRITITNPHCTPFSARVNNPVSYAFRYSPNLTTHPTPRVTNHSPPHPFPADCQSPYAMQWPRHLGAPPALRLLVNEPIAETECAAASTPSAAHSPLSPSLSLLSPTGTGTPSLSLSHSLQRIFRPASTATAAAAAKTPPLLGSVQLRARPYWPITKSASVCGSGRPASRPVHPQQQRPVSFEPTPSSTATAIRRSASAASTPRKLTTSSTPLRQQHLGSAAATSAPLFYGSCDNILPGRRTRTAPMAATCLRSARSSCSVRRTWTTLRLDDGEEEEELLMRRRSLQNQRRRFSGGHHDDDDDEASGNRSDDELEDSDASDAGHGPQLFDSDVDSQSSSSLSSSSSVASVATEMAHLYQERMLRAATAGQPRRSRRRRKLRRSVSVQPMAGDRIVAQLAPPIGVPPQPRFQQLQVASVPPTRCSSPVQQQWQPPPVGEQQTNGNGFPVWQQQQPQHPHPHQHQHQQQQNQQQCNQHQHQRRHCDEQMSSSTLANESVRV